MDFWRLFFLCCLVCCGILLPVSSLYCAQCNHGNPGCPRGNVPATPCPAGTRHCSIYRIFVNGGTSIYRTCSNVSRSSEGTSYECRSLQLFDRRTVVCAHFCPRSGCNSIAGFRTRGRPRGS